MLSASKRLFMEFTTLSDVAKKVLKSVSLGTRLSRVARPALFSLTLVLVTLAIPATGFADFQGQVVRLADNQPVEEAKLTLDRMPADGEPEFEVFSELFGFFRVADVPDGSYQLTVTHPSYLESKETVNLEANIQGDRRKIVRLVSAEVRPVFSIDFEVYDLATMVPLEGAILEAEYWEPDGTVGGSRDRLFTATAGRLGKGGLSQMEDGFYRFKIKRQGWEDLDYMADPSLGVLSGDRLRLIRDHLAGIYMKPLRFPMEVQVNGYDPVLDEADQPLKNMVLKLTGYDFQFDNLALPATTMLTDTSGEFVYTNLVPINYKLSIAKLGYKPIELDIEQAPAGGFPHVEATVELEPTKVRVVLDSPYETVDAVTDAEISLVGVKDSSSEGIERRMVSSVEEDGETVSALFENLMPGRYWIRVDHEALIDGLPSMSGPLFGPDAFQIAFYPREAYVQVEPGMTEDIVLDLAPIPARISGSLWATDQSANLEFEPCFSEPNREFVLRQQNDIQFIEHAVVNLLKEGYEVTAVDTDGAGNYTIEVLPGLYGIKIPGMQGYSGHNIEFGDVSMGSPTFAGAWPYPDEWPYGNFEFGHHRSGLRLDSDHEYQLDMFTHKHFIHIGGFISRDGEPFDSQALSMDPDGQNPVLIPYNYLWDTEAMVVLEGPVSKSVRVGEDFRYLIKDLPAGDYSLRIEHPDYISEPKPISITGWDAPGILPRVEPFTPTYFFPGISHCGSQFDLEVSWKHRGSVNFETVRFDSSDQEYRNSGLRNPTYFMSTSTGTKMIRYLRNQSLPPGSYTVWVEHGEGWLFASGTGENTFGPAIEGGPLDNTTQGNSPFFMGSGSGQTTVGTLSDFKIDLRAVSAGDHNREISDVTVEFPDGVTAPAGGIVTFSGSPYPQSAQQAQGQWTYAFWPPARVKVIDPEEKLLSVMVFMQRAMVIEGTLLGSDGDPVRQAAIVVRNRYGNPIGQTLSSQNGTFRLSQITPQTVYLDIKRRGYKNRRVVFAPEDLNNPDFLNQEITMEIVPAPTINSFTMNRFGTFIPGVTKAGDSNISSLGLNPEASRGKLTATWQVDADPQSYTVDLPGFYGSDERPKISEFFRLVDEVAEVWIVDRRYFKSLSVNELNSDDVGSVEVPAKVNYQNIREWLSEISSGERNGEPYSVVHKIALASDVNNNLEFEGKIPLWELPAGEFTPRVVVITKNGGVAIADYETPQVGGTDDDGNPNKAEPLRGMTLPRWAANILEIVGTASNLPSFSAPENDDEDDDNPGNDAAGGNRREGTGSLNRNFGDRFLKIANSGKIEARIGVVPIDSTNEGEDRTVFNPLEDLLENDLYLTYKYVIGVEVPVGEETPQNGALSLASSFLGLKISGEGVDVEFEVAGSDNQACVALVLAAAAEREKDEKEAEESAPAVAKKAKKAGADIEIKGPDVSVSAKFASCHTFISDDLGRNQLAATTGIIEVQGLVETGASVDITPVIEIFPYGKPIQELNELIELLTGFKALQIQGLFEFDSGVKVTSTIEFKIPQGVDRSTTQERDAGMAETPAYNFLGRVNDKVEDERRLIFRFAVGLKGSIANGALQATGLLQAGAPKGASDTDGIFVEVNKFGESPFIKQVDGAISLVLRAQLNLYVTSMKKSWQYDLLTFSFERGSVPIFDLTPLHTSSVVITPAAAPPAVFRGQDEVLVDQFYDAGSFDVESGGAEGLVYTGTDPDTGEMILMMSQKAGEQWVQPTEIARAAGILSSSIVQLEDGSWLAIWSELVGDDVLNPYPSTVLKSASSSDGQNWSPETVLLERNDAIYGLEASASSEGAYAAFVTSDQGPLGRECEVRVLAYEGGQWSNANIALPTGPWGRHKLAVSPVSTPWVVASTLDQRLVAVTETEQGWGEPVELSTSSSNAFDLATHSGDRLTVGFFGLDQRLKLVDIDAFGTGPAVAELDIVSGSNELELTYVDVDGEERLLMTWLPDTGNGQVWARWIALDGTPLTEPYPATYVAGGTFSNLVLEAGGFERATLTGLFTDQNEIKSLRQFSLAIPDDSDCDGDGRLDILAIAEGKVLDCNNNGLPDRCEIIAGLADDINGDFELDVCDPMESGDCNLNGLNDADEIALGLVEDVNSNGIPDDCEGEITEPQVQFIEIQPADSERYFRASDVEVIGSDGRFIILQYRGQLESSIGVQGPWAPFIP